MSVDKIIHETLPRLAAKLDAGLLLLSQTCWLPAFCSSHSSPVPQTLPPAALPSSSLSPLSWVAALACLPLLGSSAAMPESSSAKAAAGYALPTVGSSWMRKHLCYDRSEASAKAHLEQLYRVQKARPWHQAPESFCYSTWRPSKAVLFLQGGMGRQRWCPLLWSKPPSLALCIFLSSLGSRIGAKEAFCFPASCREGRSTSTLPHSLPEPLQEQNFPLLTGNSSNGLFNERYWAKWFWL